MLSFPAVAASGNVVAPGAALLAYGSALGVGCEPGAGGVRFCAGEFCACTPSVATTATHSAADKKSCLTVSSLLGRGDAAVQIQRLPGDESGCGRDEEQ